MKKEKYTLKQIREWFRKLEENKYRKRYKIDAKRICYFANNGVDSTLPASISKKNENAAYKRDRYLSKKFVKHIKEQEKIRKQKNLRNESKLRSIINTIIKEEIKDVSR